MSPWKVILATMVIFVCGVVTGALVIKTQGRHPTASFGQSSSPFGAPGPAPVWDIVRRMDQAHLNLTTNQHEKIVKIMQDSQATNTAIRARIAPQLQAEKDRAQKAINLLLTTEQQDKFADLLKKPESRPDGRGRRGGESSGFPMRNPNRFPTNGFPEDGRGRMGRRGPGASNSPPAENPAPTNSAPTDPPPTNP